MSNFSIRPHIFVLFCAVTIPLCPKIRIDDNVFIYWQEIVMAIYSIFFYIFKLKWLFNNKYIKTFFLFLCFILFSNLLNGFVYGFDFSGMARILKLFIYLPLFYTSTLISRKHILCKVVIGISIFAMAMNVLMLVSNILKGYDIVDLIWKQELMVSGLSNRYFDLKKMKLNVTGSGAHGIWLNYCTMMIILAYTCLKKRIISKSIFIFLLSLYSTNLLMSSSREGLLVLFVYLIFSYFHALRKIFIVKKKFVYISLILALFIGLVIKFSDNLGIIKKIVYTYEKISAGKMEGNIQTRINSWKISSLSFMSEPCNSIFGYGWNKKAYVSALSSAKNKYSFSEKYIALPESLIMMGLVYGGIFGLMLILLHFYHLFRFCFYNYNNFAIRNYLFFLIGIFIVNIISGASYIADLFLAQNIIVQGLILKESIFSNGQKMYPVSQC